MKCRVKRVYNLVTPREPLVVLANCKIGWPIYLAYYILLGDNDVMKRYAMEHFLFPGNIDFAADDQGALECCIYEGLIGLCNACETTFMIGESGAIFYAYDTEQQEQQVTGNPRRRKFSTKTPLENAD